MIRVKKGRLVTTFLGSCLGLAGLAGIAGAEPAPASPPPPLRSAEAILDDYAAALGGAKAWAKHKTVRVKRQIEAKGMNVRGTEERFATSAGKALTVTTIVGAGTFRQGSNGRIRWGDDPINGLRILKGAEDEEARIEAIWDSDLKLKKLYAKVRSVEPPLPVPPGKRYECVELVPKLAPSAVACFDAETHLRVLQKGTRASPQGEVPYVTYFRDWRELEGITLPYEEELSAGPITFQARVLEFAVNEKLNSKIFELPKPKSR